MLSAARAASRSSNVNSQSPFDWCSLYPQNTDLLPHLLIFQKYISSSTTIAEAADSITWAASLKSAEIEMNSRELPFICPEVFCPRRFSTSSELIPQQKNDEDAYVVFEITKKKNAHLCVSVKNSRKSTKILLMKLLILLFLIWLYLILGGNKLVQQLLDL